MSVNVHFKVSLYPRDDQYLARDDRNLGRGDLGRDDLWILSRQSYQNPEQFLKEFVQVKMWNNFDDLENALLKWIVLDSNI